MTDGVMGKRKDAEQTPEVAPKEAAADAKKLKEDAGDVSPNEATEATQETAEAITVEAEDWHDRYLRLAAEFDNFRKRSAREFGDLIANAERELIAELTEVLDNLERGLNADHKGESVEEFAKGVALIRDQLWGSLGRRGLARMETVGEPFDPEAHDALMRMPSDEYDEGIVVQEVSPGYRLGDKVLRHAKVIVSQGKAREDSAADEREEEQRDTDQTRNEA